MGGPGAWQMAWAAQFEADPTPCCPVLSPARRRRRRVRADRAHARARAAGLADPAAAARRVPVLDRSSAVPSSATSSPSTCGSHTARRSAWPLGPGPGLPPGPRRARERRPRERRRTWLVDRWPVPVAACRLSSRSRRHRSALPAAARARRQVAPDFYADLRAHGSPSTTRRSPCSARDQPHGHPRRPEGDYSNALGLLDDDSTLPGRRPGRLLHRRRERRAGASRASTSSAGWIRPGATSGSGATTARAPVHRRHRPARRAGLRLRLAAAPRLRRDAEDTPA